MLRARVPNLLCPHSLVAPGGGFVPVAAYFKIRSNN
jgi:hypothetical protein